MPEEKSIIATYAEAGARLLDERVPNWADRIDILDLDLSSTESCVLGQVYAAEAEDVRSTGWSIGMRALFGDTSHAYSVPYGFERRGVDVNRPMREYTELREAWVPLIEARQSPGDQNPGDQNETGA